MQIFILIKIMTAILFAGKKAMATATATKIKKEPQVKKMRMKMEQANTKNYQA